MAKTGYFFMATDRFRELWLDTSQPLIAARSLYLSAGYVDTPRYNNDNYADFWMAKTL